MEEFDTPGDEKTKKYGKIIHYHVTGTLKNTGYQEIFYGREEKVFKDDVEKFGKSLILRGISYKLISILYSFINTLPVSLKNTGYRKIFCARESEH